MGPSGLILLYPVRLMHIMDVLSILLIAVGLAMDAFAVSVCKGLAVKGLNWRHALLVGLWFGGFQGLMPVLGYYLGSTFSGFIAAYDHWAVFIILGFIGFNMIREALSDDGESIDDDLGLKTMALLAIATSIDALAVGVTFAVSGDGILLPAMVIGVVTLVISMFGVWIGGRFGNRYGDRAELVGGSILVLLGFKFLLEGLGVF